MVDHLSAVRLMMNLLEGCVGPERLLTLNLTWELFAGGGGRDFAPKELLKAFDEQLFRLGVLVRVQSLMAEATDLSFLFHQLELFPPMIKRIYANPSLAPRLPVTIAALEDAALRLRHTCHETDGADSLAELRHIRKRRKKVFALLRTSACVFRSFRGLLCSDLRSYIFSPCS